jgi:transposase
MGHLTMSSKEAPRPGLVKAALAGNVTNAQAAKGLGLSVRQFRRLKAAFRRAGVQGLLHGNRGRPSPRRLGEEDRRRIVALINTRYAGLNDCHLTEKLRECEGLQVCREVVRQLRRAAGIAPIHRRRAPRHRARRLRAAREGALVLIDGSEFAWLGAAPPLQTLLGAIDDATGKILALHFRPHEDLHGYASLLHTLVETYGLPLSLYGDRLAVFVRNDRHWSLEEQLAGRQQPTQFGQMLEELAIGFIAAGSPEAKGRIERLWRTLQDRLVAELRLRGLTTREAAEAFLPEFIADYNRRFALPSREAASVWRRPPRPLDHVLACRYHRTVAKDNTVTLPGRWIQIPPGPHGRSWHRCRVEVRELLDGRLLVLHPDRGVIAEQPPPAVPFTLAPRDSASPKRRAALGIDAPESPRIDDRPPARLQSPARRTPLGRLTNIRRPSKTHPWKRSYDPNLLPQPAGAGGT